MICDVIDVKSNPRNNVKTNIQTPILTMTRMTKITSRRTAGHALATVGGRNTFIVALTIVITLLSLSTSHYCDAFLIQTPTTTSSSVARLDAKKPPPQRGPTNSMTADRRKKLGIADNEDEYDLEMALDNNTDPIITKIIAGRYVLQCIVSHCKADIPVENTVSYLAGFLSLLYTYLTFFVFFSILVLRYQSLIISILTLLVFGIVIPATTDYGEGVCNPLLTGGRC
jgi:hypothetical protein